MIREFGMADFGFLMLGLQWTIMMSAVAFIVGALGGLGVALARTSTITPLRVAAGLLIEIFQGTPLLMQLFIVYYGIAFLDIDINAWLAVTIGLTLHASAFLGEIWRGSIEAVSQGQSEAARALGLRYFARMRWVVLPQAFRIGLPATIGFSVHLIKGTSLAAILGFTELARAAQMIANATYQPLLVYGIAAAMYFFLCWPLSLVSDRIEAHHDRQQR